MDQTHTVTKMMRGNDSQDMEDIAFLVRHGGVTSEQMAAACVSVRMPDVQELRDAFDRALPVLQEILRNGGREDLSKS